MPENRFKQLREEEAGRRRDKDPKCELFTQDKLSKELFDKCHYYISSSKIKKTGNQHRRRKDRRCSAACL
jgi:hypothetical protein|nr:MAG TPA: hypothetical protein [Bacteriophage sp.]